MRKHGADAHFISTLDDIAWLFNLRGAGVDYNPVFVGHALVGLDYATLFVAEGKVDETLRAVLAADGVDVAGYAQAAEALGSLELDQTLLIDPARVTCGVFHAMNPDVPRVEAINPSTLLKSRKTEAELANVRQAMEQDGAALCEFFAWFEGALGKERITELTIDEQITAARAPARLCLSQLRHHRRLQRQRRHAALPRHRRIARRDRRRWPAADRLGRPVSGRHHRHHPRGRGGRASADQKVDFTLVLKGMIALSRASFPRGTPSPMLDAIARAPIWEGGAEYGHGTGHGVGYFLNVHEGPQVISYRAAPGPHTAMEPGMITSNEPGIYRPGRWGVRIENLVANRSWLTSELGEFLCFETLTLCPIDTRCIEPSLLRDDERAWLNDYHKTVFERLSPLVEGDALAWLTLRCKEV